MCSQSAKGVDSFIKALSPEGNPSFATVAKVAKALGLKIKIEPAQ